MDVKLSLNNQVLRKLSSALAWKILVTVHRLSDPEIYFGIDNHLQLFRIRFNEELLCNQTDYFYNFSGDKALAIINNYVKELSTNEYSSEFKPISFTDFHQSETTKLAEIDSSTWTDTEKQNLSDYKKFLDHHRVDFTRIDVLKKSDTTLFKAFSNLIEGKLNKEMVQANKIDQTFGPMLKQLDRAYLLHIINFTNTEMTATVSEETMSSFDFDYFKNPGLLEPFEEEKQTFFKFFKVYIKDLLAIRKKVLKLQELPPIYHFLEEYAESLNTTTAKPKEYTPEKTVAAQVPEDDYPKYIFHTVKDYRFFLQMMSFVTNTAQISFIYRTMAEQEVPPKILVKDTPFREWFNTQEFTLTLDTHTITLNNAKNKDREMWYNMAKKLIFSNS